MEYKVGRLLGNKPKEHALSDISDKLLDGDVVRLTSDIIDSAVITSDITIDGQGHTYYVEDAGGAGLILKNNCRVINCNFVIGKKTNGIYARVYNLNVELENCTFKHVSWEDSYPSITSGTYTCDHIICNNVDIDYGILSTKRLSGQNISLGNPACRYFTDIECNVDNKNHTATEIDVGTLTTVGTRLYARGQIKNLICLNTHLDSMGEHILVGDLTLRLDLDSQEDMQWNAIIGVFLLSNTTIERVITPNSSERTIKRHQQCMQAFKVNPKEKNTVININGGEWSIENHWVNQIYRGTINFKNYIDVNEWFFKSEDAVGRWENSKFRYKNTFEATKKEEPKKDKVSSVETKPKTAKEKLDEMIGLAEVKKKVQAYIATNLANKKRKELGMEVEASSLHLIFGGSAGTGKTQVARLLTDILYENGIIKKNLLKEVSAKDMVAKYTGQTSTKTHELIESALGGVLFIDEAYELIPGDDSDTFKKEAITTLVKDMDDYRADLIVIMAGYTDEMEKLLKVNAGLPSRFVNKIHFPDYSEDELIAIAQLQLRQQKQVLTDEAREKLENVIRKAKQNEQVDGNGRWVRNLLQFIRQARDVRIVTQGLLEDTEALNTITLVDVEEGITNI